MVSHRRIMWSLIVSNLVLMFGFQVWQTVFNNLAVEELGLEAGAVGLIQSIREIPGLAGFFFVVMVAVLGSEFRVMGVNILVLGGGLLFTGLARNLPSLILGTLVTSIGFHYFTSGSQAVLLQVTSQTETPRALGRLSSVGALAAVMATVGVVGAALVMNNRQIMSMSGVLVIVAGLALFPRMNISQSFVREETPARKSLRKDYWLFYALTFLMGTRRHIFSTFAIFLLVSVHGLETWQTATLFLLNGVVSFLTLPQLGRLVGIFGERRMLILNSALLIGIFVGYATIQSTMVLIALFILDNLLIGFTLAISSYFQKIAVTPQDITPNMSLGQSINHIAAVIIPVLGGWMWQVFDPAMPFLSGALIALVSLVLLHWMEIPRREQVWEPVR